MAGNAAAGAENRGENRTGCLERGKDASFRATRSRLSMKRLFLTGVVALFLATGAAHADAVYDDDWNWSGCKLDGQYPRFTVSGERIDEDYYSCENGRDFEFF